MTHSVPESCVKQMNSWIEGSPEHNKERDECCIDFSCCSPKCFVADKSERIRTALNIYQQDFDGGSKFICCGERDEND